jgi:recombination protein RecA
LRHNSSTGEQKAKVSAALQSVLQCRFAGVLRFRDAPAQDPLPSGLPHLDLPRGSVTEIHGLPSSGRTTLLLSALAQATAREEICALIDVDDTFDPASATAAGVALDRMLWIRCGSDAERALKVTDLIVQGGGFGLVAMDLGSTPPEIARRIPPASWFRFRHAVQNTRSVLLVIEQFPFARTCAAQSLEAKRESIHWPGTLLMGTSFSLSRVSGKPCSPVSMAPAQRLPAAPTSSPHTWRSSTRAQSSWMPPG